MNLNLVYREVWTNYVSYIQLLTENSVWDFNLVQWVMCDTNLLTIALCRDTMPLRKLPWENDKYLLENIQQIVLIPHPTTHTHV